jgi:hypothetical protein
MEVERLWKRAAFRLAEIKGFCIGEDGEFIVGRVVGGFVGVAAGYVCNLSWEKWCR